ncbi:amidohydrolase [Flavobacterium sp. MAH-1]|uniref:Omega-amidase YafV n=1 Tax=Flavobacterium agri TaxID=2743471 RepID=A0A7Y8Y2I4_9FLAO|nr:amidohydrolase [Flavobacterium agri]NUY81342.1 amidohydrolase [Flavobacterium agri]NYA71366.1 amidohydrolase [Flavobacterium agri]
METQLNIALVQTPLVWQDCEANRNLLEEKINAIAEPVDIIVLPEMFSTGFTMTPNECAETMNGKSVKWMKRLASEKNSAIVGSLVIKSGVKCYNRLLFVRPTGEIETYDKRHLFTLAGEDKVYTSGRKKLVLDYKGFKICPLICYDLRFPAFSRNVEDYDLLIYVANWPLPRIAAWDALLKARAIENMCYVVGVNRVGEDWNKHQYPGHSQVLDYLGETLLSAWENEGVFIIGIDKRPMLETREKLAFLNDRDNIKVS